jgi:hypothetical protein
MLDPQRHDSHPPLHRLAPVPPPMPLRAVEDGRMPVELESLHEPVGPDRQRELDEREAALERREAAVAEQEADLAAARAAFDKREAELQQAGWQLAEERVALEAERDRLDAAARAVAEQPPVAREPDELDAERGRLARAEALLEKRQAEVERLRKSLPLVPGTFVWDVDALARLVELCAPEFPERVDEWRAYVAELERSKNPDGSLPGRLDPLIWDVFGAILERPRLPFAV